MIAFMLMNGVLFFSPVNSQVDYGQAILGTWEFDLGMGYMATIEYRSDGTFEQKVDEMITGGTYTVNGTRLKTVTREKATMFTIISLVDNKLTIKRDRDGRTIVYIRK
ncbi:MAG: hypothetical protein A2176_14845 [Spirochaetes bacterium RBG_13_51_14]|nr:MAG: hypothetical protein A2176_14845 [Spirochaetes bacterium RBG_13_51_14]